jgi:hypothetical protein
VQPGKKKRKRIIPLFLGGVVRVVWAGSID